MWCVCCHVAFSWKTGEIVTSGPVHNPHYYAWLRTQHPDGDIPRNAGDIPGGGCQLEERIPPAWTLRRLLNPNPSNKSMYEPYVDALFSVHRQVLHVRESVLNANLNLRLLPPDEENLDLRRKYLAREIDEDKWKSMLVAREKRRERIEAFVNAYGLLCNLAGPMFRQMHPELDSLEDIYNQLYELTKYVKTAVDDVAKRFKCTTPYDIKLPEVNV